MSLLCANLKQIYQRWMNLLFYGAVGVAVCCLVMDQLCDKKVRLGEYAGLFIPGVLVGVWVTDMLMGVLSRPFSFCLPGYHGVIRRLILVVGLVESLVFSLPFLGYPGLFDTSPAWGVLVLCSAFCANMMVYMASITIGVTVIAAVALLPLLPASVVLIRMIGLDVAIERSIVQFPLVIIPLTGIMAAVGWWWLGRPEWFRRRSGQPWTELLCPWSRSQTQRCRQAQAARRFPKNLNPAVDRFLLHSISARGLSDLPKHIWGALYPTCALIVPQWKGLVFVVVLGTIVAGYEPSAAPFVMGIVPMILAGFLESHAQSLQHIAVGRRERLAVAVVLMSGFGAASVLVVGTAVAFTHLLAVVVPPVQIKGIVFALQPIRSTVFWIPLTVFPGMTLIHTLFHQNPAKLGLAMGLMFGLVFWFVTPFGKHAMVTPAIGVFGVLVLWAACLATTYRFAMHGDLARR